jgi:peptidoglycan/LPS O-acetylase OafA/YrhL
MPTPSTVSRRPEIPALTSLRFFAALWVAAFHIGELGLWKGGYGWYRATAHVGYVGVSFFFVLSGFILVYVYSGRGIPKIKFWQARFARIYPAYAFSLLVTLPGLLYSLPTLKKMHDTALILITYPLLLEAWFPSILLFWNAVAWSLSVEMIFYLLFPFVIPKLDRLKTRAVSFWIVACWIVSLVITGSYVALRPDGVAHTTSMDNQLFWLGVVKLNPIARLPEFLLGMGFGALFLRLEKKPRIWPLVIGVAFVVIAICLQGYIPYPVMHTGLLAPAFGLIVFGFATQPVKGLLASKPLVLLGEASYSFYLLHVFPIAIMSFLMQMSSSPHIRAIVGIYLVSMIVISILVYLGIERPMRRLLRPRSRVLPADDATRV